MTHSPNDPAELLELLQAGSIELDGPEMHKLREANPEVAEELERAFLVALQLDDMAQEEASALAEVRSESTREGQPVEEAVEARMAQLLRPVPSMPPPRSRLGWVAAMAAAAILTAVLVPRFRADPDPVAPDPVDPTFLSEDGDAATDLAPSGAVSSFQRFTWTGELEEGASWVVAIYDDGENAGLDPIATSNRLYTNEWTPDAATIQSLPESIRWELSLHDAAGTFVDVVGEALAVR